MKALFSTYTLGQEKLQAGQIPAVLQACRQDAWTGLLRIESDASQYLITVLGGEIDGVYHFEQAYWKALPEQGWDLGIRAHALVLTRFPLAPEGMRLCRLFLGQQAQNSGALELSAGQVQARLQAWSEKPEPAILYIREADAENLVVIPGMNIPLLEALSLAPSSVNFFVASPGDLSLQAGSDYQAYYFKVDAHQDGWREYSLRLAFMAFMRLLVLRFGDLAGRALSQRVCSQLTEINRGRGWEIALDGNTVVHRQIFANLDEASQAYSHILSLFLSYTGQVVGARLAMSMVEMMLLRLSPLQREILQARILELRIPEIDRAEGYRPGI